MTGQETEETDQYDSLLRAMEEGLIISINDGTSSAMPTGELTVVYSKDDETHVCLNDGEKGYRIHRKDNGAIVYSEETEDGLSFVDGVITLEVLGIA